MQTMRKIRIYLSFLLIMLDAFVGAFFYSGNEGWSFLNGFYWASETITSIGYGDLAIQHESSRFFGMFYVLISCCIYAAAVNNLFDLYYQVIPREDADEAADEEFEEDRAEALTQRTVPSKLAGLSLESFQKRLRSGISMHRNYINRNGRDSVKPMGDPHAPITSDVLRLETLVASGFINYELDVIPILDVSLF